MKKSRQKAVGGRRSEQTRAAPRLNCARRCEIARARLSQPAGDLRRTSFSRLIILLCLLPAAFCLLSCGKRRPPEPPIEKVPQRTELLSGVQRGNEVILNWPAPRRNAPSESVQSIRRVDVYRVAEKPNDPLPLTEEEFASRSTLIGSVTYEEMQRGGDTLSYTDGLLELPSDRAGLDRQPAARHLRRYEPVGERRARALDCAEGQRR